METVSSIIFIAIIVVVFLLLREFWCWYFKINKITELLEKLVKNTSLDTNESNHSSTQSSYKANRSSCLQCQKSQIVTETDKSKGGYYCLQCGHFNKL